MIDVKALLDEVKAQPFTYVEVKAPHTGILDFAVAEPGAKVYGPSGAAGEKTGTLVATIEREHNKKPIYAPQNGELSDLSTNLKGKFVEAGQTLYVIRHYLTKEEVIDLILKKTLHLFEAPERAKYYFTPEVDKKVRASGPESVTVTSGMDLFIVSRMKRETPLSYTGPEGNIYAVYFKHNDSVDQGAPLIGVCPTDQLHIVQDVVNNVQSEWVEKVD